MQVCAAPEQTESGSQTTPLCDCRKLTPCIASFSRECESLIGEGGIKVGVCEDKTIVCFIPDSIVTLCFLAQLVSAIFHNMAARMTRRSRTTCLTQPWSYGHKTAQLYAVQWKHPRCFFDNVSRYVANFDMHGHHPLLLCAFFNVHVTLSLTLRS